MNKEQSNTINYLRFLLIGLIVICHAYTATQSVEWLNKGHLIYGFITNNLSLLWGGIAVPFLFFFSGYLYFIHFSIENKHHLNKWKKCIQTLLLPYIIWNFLTLILYYFLQNNTLTSPYFTGFYQPIANYSYKDFFQAFWAVGEYARGNGTPILSPYWFIRNLIILYLLAPIIYWLNIRTKYSWLLIIGMIWMCVPHMAFSICSIFWFSIGAYFSIYHSELYIVFRKKFSWQLGIWLTLWVLYNIFYLGRYGKIGSVILQRLFITSSIPILYVWVYQGISIRKWKINKTLPASSFFIYTIHYPLILGLRKIMVKMWPNASDGISILLWIASIGIVIGGCYGIYRFMRRFFPHLLSLLCGGRS